MDEQQHSIDELFRQSLGDYREAPPAAAWDDVVNRLDGPPPVPGKYFLNNPWLIVTLLVVITGAVYLLGGNKNGIGKPSAAARLGAVSTITIQKPMALLPADTLSPVQLPVPEAGNTAQQDAAAGAAKRPAFTSSGHRTKQIGLRSNSRNAAYKRYSLKDSPAASVAPTTSISQNAVLSGQKRRRERLQASSGKPSKSAAEQPSASGKNTWTKRQAAASARAKRSSGARAIVRQRPVTNQEKATPPVVPSASPAEQRVTAHHKATSSSKLKNIAPERQKQPKARREIGAPLSSSSGQAGERTTAGRTATRSKQPPVAGASNPPASAKRVKNPPADINKPEKSPDEVVASRTVNSKSDALTPATGKTPTKAPEEDSTDVNEDPVTAGAAGSTMPAGRRRGIDLSLPLSLDVMAGYEWGVQRPAPNRIAFAAQLSWHLNTRLSIGVIPAYRFGNVNNQQLNNGGLFGSYAPVRVDSFRINVIDTTGRIIGVNYSYKISQTYDSIRATAAYTGGRLWELELPIIAAYQAGNWRFSAGPTLNFGGRLQVGGNARQVYPVSRRDSVVYFNRSLPADSFSNYFGNNLPAYNSTNADQVTPSGVRIGYAAGIGYQYRGFLIDLGIRQQLTGFSNLLPEVKKVYSSPTIRISVGYRIFGPRPLQRSADHEHYFMQRL